MKNKAIIAVLAGGYSGESQVSMKSAKTILDNLDESLFESYLVKVEPGEWSVNDHGEEKRIDLSTFSFEKNAEKIPFDYAYIIIHGTPGEDGKLQGYLDMMGVPYSTGSVLNTALTFNKARTQRLMIQEGVKIAKHLIFSKQNIPSDALIVKELGLPCFVKPTESGSSIGVSMVKYVEGLQKAIRDALLIHHEVIIETMLHGRELACGVCRIGDEVMSLPVTEISSDREFFDYEAKYEDDATTEITPAMIPESIYLQCQELSRNVYSMTECKGIARADFFLCEDGLYFVEINTIPGMSKESLVPKQIKAAGLDLQTVLTEIIQEDIKQ